MNEIPANHSSLENAQAIVQEFRPQVALFLEFGKKYNFFVSMEQGGIALYKKFWRVQVLAYIVDYALTHYPDAAHGVIESLLETTTETGDDGLYTVFLEIYERDLKSPQRDHGVGYELALCASELARVEQEKKVIPTHKFGPHQFFRPERYDQIVKQLGHTLDPVYTNPFDTELAQALGETKNTTTKDLFDTLNQ